MSVMEVAKKAGVSIATVSRVLNDHPAVHPETVRLVRQAMVKVKYDPHAIRRGPRIGKRSSRTAATTIGIVTVGVTHECYFKLPVFAAAVSSVTRAAAANHLNLAIDEVLDADHLSERLQSGVLSGALVFAASSAQRALVDALRKVMPIVRVMGSELAARGVDQVLPDNLAIGHLALEYLFERGCRELAFVTTIPDLEAMQLRELAFRSAAKASGLASPVTFAPASEQSTPPFSQSVQLEAIADAIAAHTPRPTGIFVSQDIETIGLYPLLMARGIHPGRDVTIISCNNEESISILRPRPASIDYGADEIGRRAVTRLLNRIAHPEEPSMRMLVAAHIPVLVEDR